MAQSLLLSVCCEHLCCVVCVWRVKLSAEGKSEASSSQNKSRRVDKQLVGTASDSNLTVSSSRRRQHLFGKSSRKRPAEVSFGL